MAQFGGSIPSFSISSNYQTNHIAIPNMQHDLSTSSSTISLRRSPSYYDMTPKNQTKSKSKIVKRSKSTPNLKAVISPSSDPDSPEDSAEKKRSKLGYHRTSVACGHCRKRKIRCQPPPDQSGKCSNCIRLKKECSYFPIVQATADDTKARHQESGESETLSSFVSSVSPHLKDVDSSQGHNHSHITGVPIRLSPEYAYYQENSNVTAGPEGFPSLQHSASWDSQIYRAFPTISEDVSQDCTIQQEQWKAPEMPMNPNTQQHYSRPPTEYPQSTLAPAMHDATPRPETGWIGTPQRTASGNDMTYTNYHPNTSYHSHTMQDMTRRSSTISYPSSLSIADHPSTPSLNESTSTIPASSASGTHGLSSQYAYNPHYPSYTLQHHQAMSETMQPPDGFGYHTTKTWYADTNHHRL